MQPSLSASPASRDLPPVPDAGLRPFSRLAAVAAILASMPLVALVLTLIAEGMRPVGNDVVLTVFAVSSLGALAGGVLAVVAVVRLSRISAEVRPRGRWLAGLAIPTALLLAPLGLCLAYLTSPAVQSF